MSHTMVDEIEAAEMIGLKPATLRRWRSTGSGALPYYKLGPSKTSLVRYSIDDIRTWLAAQRCEVLTCEGGE